MVTRSAFKRETLIRNIQKAITRAQEEVLPATIKEVYAFGGILRDKERAHDFDAVFLYEQTQDQKARWDWFARCFGHLQDEIGKMLGADEIRNHLYAVLRPYHDQGISLRKAVRIESIAKALKQKGIEPSWAGCFSWTDVFYNPYGLFLPDMSKVLRSLLCGEMKGIQVIFRNYSDFKQGHTLLIAKNFRLAWSPERQDIKKNLEMSVKEKIEFVLNELKLFIEQLTQLKSEFSNVLSDLVVATQNAGLKLNLEQLKSKHIEISYDEQESYENLLAKCELARNEIRAYREETEVLRNLTHHVKFLEEKKNDEFYDRYSLEDWATYWTIMHTPKYEVKEERIREVLKNLGLPENHVVTIRSYSMGTQFELEPDIRKREESFKKTEEEKIKSSYLKPLNKVVRSFDRNYYIHIELERQKPKLLVIGYRKWFEYSEGDLRKAALGKLRLLGFEIHDRERYISAHKTIKIKGNESIKDLERIVRDFLKERV